jgi:hypothetical protein
MAADDFTVVGVADVPLIPFVVAGGSLVNITL